MAESAESTTEAVLVGVRIRPFNDREKGLNANCCIAVHGPTTLLYNADDPAREFEPRKFTFDASFWSHDGFTQDANGFATALPGSIYADQQHVFNTFGAKVLDNAWEGYHCCLFAYGQTGSGKSYSMVGYGANKGIVPISCEEIFRRIGLNTDPGLTYEVMVSMIEIYNEQVQDLLVNPKYRSKKGLEIRESQQLGIYVDKVVKRPVDSYAAIEAAIDEGTSNRTLGATLMNATSSRAHTVQTIEFKQVSTIGDQKGVKVSLINLVDLAGSEKAAQSGATGDRLKEGCSINKSLSALGNVIERLADRSQGKLKAGAVIPYRDSKLTRLLTNALGGSSKTIMICAISPASSNHDETLSTLRYADRAKRIKNTAVVNEDPQDRIIRQLREENTKLKEMVGTDTGSTSTEEMKLKQEEISALEEALKEMQKDFSQKLREAQEKLARQPEAVQRTEITQVHMTNLNEDPLLTNKMVFSFKSGKTDIGKSAAGYEPAVSLAGVGIQNKHASVINMGGRCSLVAEPSAANATFVNGEALIGKPIVLRHGDRLAFGQTFFVFVDPKQSSADKLLSSGAVNFELALKELTEKQGGLGTTKTQEEIKAEKQKMEELERKVREAEEAKLRAEAEAAELMRRREEEHERQTQEMRRIWDDQMKGQALEEADQQKRLHEEELQRLQRDFEERQKAAEAAAQQRMMALEKQAIEFAAEEHRVKQSEIDLKLLEEKLMMIMPLVKEANLIAQELDRPYELETKMHVEPSGVTRGEVQVNVAVKREGVLVYEWPPETIENRIYLMRELFERCCDEEFCVEDLQEAEDPYWDPIRTERLIGVAQILLESLSVQLENELDAKILSTEGKQAGTLRIELWPVSKDGNLGIPDHEAVEQAEDLLGTKMDFLIRIVAANRLPDALANNVRVEFHYFLDDEPYHMSAEPGQNSNPVFNYEKRFIQDPVTTKFLEYLKTSLAFRVYGHDADVLKLKEADAAAEAAVRAAEAETAAQAEAEAAAQAEAEAAAQAEAEAAALAEEQRLAEEARLEAEWQFNSQGEALAQEANHAPSHAELRKKSEERPPEKAPQKARTCTIL